MEFSDKPLNYIFDYQKTGYEPYMKMNVEVTPLLFEVSDSLIVGVMKLGLESHQASSKVEKLIRESIE